ncbi:hypothetical protein [Microbacterium marmarense]|uniref:Uncharacterized protein n=1 Tax=Microbacterium marmarense TaxID=3122051 RepID=A0ABU8LRW6_9MICO
MTLNNGGFTMLDRDTADNILFRAAVAAFKYYPTRATDELGYAIDEDIDWCVKAFGDIPWPQAQRLRRSIRDVITDPTTHREQFTRDINNLITR